MLIAPTSAGKTEVGRLEQALEWLERPEPMSERGPPKTHFLVVPTISLGKQTAGFYLTRWRDKLRDSGEPELTAYAALLRVVDLSSPPHRGFTTKEAEWQGDLPLTLRNGVVGGDHFMEPGFSHSPGPSISRLFSQSSRRPSSCPLYRCSWKRNASPPCKRCALRPRRRPVAAGPVGAGLAPPAPPAPPAALSRQWHRIHNLGM